MGYWALALLIFLLCYSVIGWQGMLMLFIDYAFCFFISSYFKNKYDENWKWKAVGVSFLFMILNFFLFMLILEHTK